MQGIEKLPKIAKFNFTKSQAKAIAERRLYQLSRLDVDKVTDEFEDLKIKIAISRYYQVKAQASGNTYSRALMIW